MPNHDILGGLMVAFDIFEKKDIEKVRQKICDLFGIQPKEEKSHITFMDSHDSFEVSQNVWKINLSDMLTVLSKISDKQSFPVKHEILENYVDSLEIRGHNSPRLPFYILIAKFVLRRDLLNSSEDLRKDMFLVSQPIRLFIESFGGLTNKIAGYSPRASLVTQFWVKVTKKYLNKMRNSILEQLSESEKSESTKDFKIKHTVELSDKLRSYEPFNLAPTVGDIHSHIIDGSNIILVIGQITQPALGGLRTPYLIELSYEEELLKGHLPLKAGSHFLNLDMFSLDNIVWEGYSLLITLISFSTFMSYLASERAKIEREISKLREAISLTGLSTEQLHNHLNEINNYGTKLSSLLNLLGTFSRQREWALKQIAGGTSDFCFEVPIKSELYRFSSHKNEGYLRTISKQILGILNGTKEALSNQETEIRSLQTHISNIANLQNIRSSKTLQKLTIIIAVSGLIIAGISGSVAYQSWRTAELNYQKSHPEGTYYVEVDFLGYDEPTNYDQFRISISYQGRGESKYVRLSLGIVGSNPIVASKGNLEVMEPNIVLGRNYVNGLIGWVDYHIQRAGNITSQLNVLDYASDVEVLVINNT